MEEYEPFQPLVDASKFSNYATVCMSVGFLAFVSFLM